MPYNPHHQSRGTDPVTSHEAAANLDAAAVSHAQRVLLMQFVTAGPDGLTSREACRRAGMHEGWKRVSDLLRDGHLVDTGRTRRDPVTGRRARVLAAADLQAEAA